MIEIKFKDKKLREEISFATVCILSQALSYEEFRFWVEEKIRYTANLPHTFFDLLEIGESPKLLFLYTGNLAVSYTDSQYLAIDGIAYLRGITPYEKPSKVDAKEALRRNFGILERYQEMFPFVELPSLENY